VPARPLNVGPFGEGGCRCAEAKRVFYGKLALADYDPLCAHSGFRVPAALEAAHLDGNPQYNAGCHRRRLCRKAKYRKNIELRAET